MSTPTNHKYVAFINELYNLCKKGYTSLNAKQLTEKHDVNIHMVRSAHDLGLIEAKGLTRGRRYFWAGAAPTVQDATKVYERSITYIEKTNYKGIRETKTNVSEVKNFFQPIVPKPIDKAVEHYLTALELIWEDLKGHPKTIYDSGKYCKELSAHVTLLNILVKMNIVQFRIPYSYQWIGDKPSLEMIDKIQSFNHARITKAAEANKVSPTVSQGRAISDDMVEKYHKFLTELYLVCSSAYVPLDTLQLIKKYKISKPAFDAALTLGFLKSTGKTRSAIYHWPGTMPTEEMAENLILRMREIIRASKQGRKVNKQLPDNLIPIEKKASHSQISHNLSFNTDRDLRKKKTAENYLVAMKAIWGMTKNGPVQFIMADLLSQYKVSKGIPSALKLSGLLVKNKGGSYQWIGSEPTLEHAIEVLKKVTESCQNSGMKNETIERTPIVLHSPQIIPIVKETVTPIDANKEELKKQLAAKLVDIGDYERALKVLSEVN